jgi:Tfp pilus assembly protein PilF
MIQVTSFRSRSSFLLLIALLGVACNGSGDKKEATAADTAVAKPEDARMKEGMALFYEKNDPFGAEQAFRDVLKMNPTHYGAQFQLAKAIDREGRPAEARPMWEEMLKSAESIKDTATERMVRARLAAPDTVGAEGMMTIGLHDLYQVNNPVAAAEQFKKVLALNPTHYGATYQLAVALDRSGKQAEARQLWVKVLGMATMYKDDKTAELARARLKQSP